MSRAPEFQAARPIGKQPWPWYRGEGGGRIYPHCEQDEDAAGPTCVSWNQLAATGEYFAIKSLSRDFLEGKDGIVYAMLEAEVDAHRRISTPAVPALRDVVRDEETGQVHLVFDYGGRPILDVVDGTFTPEGTVLNTTLAAHATVTLLTTLQQLHASGYSYNDLKPHQLLWDASREARDFPMKLADFGAVTKIGSSQLLSCTCSYMPPETHAIVASGIDARRPDGIPSTLGPAFDVWGAVLSIATIALDGINPFEAPLHRKEDCPEPYPRIPGCSWDPYDAQVVLEQPTAYESSPTWDDLDPDLQDFIRAGLHPNPKERATIQQLMAMEWGRRCMALLTSASSGDNKGCVGSHNAQEREQALDPEAMTPPLQAAPEPDDVENKRGAAAITPTVDSSEPCASSESGFQDSSGRTQLLAALQSTAEAELAVEARIPHNASVPTTHSGDAAILLLAAELKAAQCERDDAHQRLAEERLENRAFMERVDTRVSEMGQQIKVLMDLVSTMQVNKGMASLSGGMQDRLHLQSSAGTRSEASGVATPSRTTVAGHAGSSSGGGSSSRSLESCTCSSRAAGTGARKSGSEGARARVLKEMWGDVKAAGRAVAGWFEQALALPSSSKGPSRAAPATPKSRRFLGRRSVMALV